MMTNIKEITVQNNEELSSNLILKYLERKKLIYIKNESNQCDDKLEPINFDPPAIILKSSGSFQKPKTCIHKVENLDNSAKYSGIWLQEQGLKLENCCIFNTLPLNHISGFMALWRSHKWQCDYISISNELLKQTKELLEKTISINNINKKTLITSLVPTQLKRLLKEPDGIKWLKLFDVIWLGGSSISIKTANQCRRAGIKLAPCYGSTETAAMISCLKPIDFLEGNNTVGEPLKDVQLKVNQKGLITINAERIGIEYVNPTNLKKFANDEGWWESSDLGQIIKINQQHFLNFLGRADNAFQSGGETVFPELIKKRLEEIISIKSLPIKDVFINKIRDEIWENRFEVLLSFNNKLKSTIIDNSLQVLEKNYRNWPNHERPRKIVVLENKLSSSNVKASEMKSWKDTED